MRAHVQPLSGLGVGQPFRSNARAPDESPSVRVALRVDERLTTPSTLDGLSSIARTIRLSHRRVSGFSRDVHCDAVPCVEEEQAVDAEQSKVLVDKENT